MGYLSTKKAVKDFYEIMLRNRYNSRETLNEWQSFLVKQGINENDVIPYRIVSSIETAISTNDVLKQFNFRYGMEPGKLVIDISTNSAGGHKKLNGKNEQISNLTTRIINPEAIYKMQSLDKMTYMSDASIVNWIITELPKHVANQIAKQILVGGVKNEDGSDYDAIYPIATDAITVKETDYYSTIDQVFAFLLDAIADIDGSYQNRVLFLNPKDYADIVRQLSTQQTAIFLNPAALGARIVTTQLIDPSDDTTFTGIAVNTDNYLIGVANKDDSLLTSFDISKNAQYIEASAWAAGSLFKINSAYAIILKLSNPNLIVNPNFRLSKDGIFVASNFPTSFSQDGENKDFYTFRSTGETTGYAIRIDNTTHNIEAYNATADSTNVNAGLVVEDNYISSITKPTDSSAIYTYGVDDKNLYGVFTYPASSGDQRVEVEIQSIDGSTPLQTVLIKEVPSGNSNIWGITFAKSGELIVGVNYTANAYFFEQYEFFTVLADSTGNFTATSIGDNTSVGDLTTSTTYPEGLRLFEENNTINEDLQLWNSSIKMLGYGQNIGISNRLFANANNIFVSRLKTKTADGYFSAINYIDGDTGVVLNSIYVIKSVTEYGGILGISNSARTIFIGSRYISGRPYGSKVSELVFSEDLNTNTFSLVLDADNSHYTGNTINTSTILINERLFFVGQNIDSNSTFFESYFIDPDKNLVIEGYDFNTMRGAPYIANGLVCSKYTTKSDTYTIFSINSIEGENSNSISAYSVGNFCSPDNELVFAQNSYTTPAMFSITDLYESNFSPRLEHISGYGFQIETEPTRTSISLSGGSKNTGEINLDFGSPVDKSPDNYIKTTFYKPKLEEGEIVTPF